MSVCRRVRQLRDMDAGRLRVAPTTTRLLSRSCRAISPDERPEKNTSLMSALGSAIGRGILQRRDLGRERGIAEVGGQPCIAGGNAFDLKRTWLVLSLNRGVALATYAFDRAWCQLTNGQSVPKVALDFPFRRTTMTQRKHSDIRRGKPARLRQ